MSEAVVVGLIAGTAAVISAVGSAIVAVYNHRHHDDVATETRRVVREIYVISNGKLEAANRRIAELEEQAAK